MDIRRIGNVGPDHCFYHGLQPDIKSGYDKACGDAEVRVEGGLEAFKNHYSIQILNCLQDLQRPTN
jgi:hypothetical protein